MTSRNLRIIALLLALTVLDSRVTAFTIRRATETTLQPDLIAAESNLEVKNDLSRLKYTTLPVGSPKSSSSEELINKDDPTTVQTTIQTAKTVVTVNETSVPPATESQSTSDTSSYTTVETIPTTEVPSFSEKAIVEDVEIGTSAEPEKSSSPVTKNVSLAYMNNTVRDNSSSTTTTTQNDVSTTVPSKEVPAELKTEVNNVVSYSTESVNYGTTISDMSSSTTIDGGDKDEKSTTTEVLSSTFATTTKNKEESRDTNSIANEPTKELKVSEKLTEGLTVADTIVTAVPYWKKYTVIDRKRLSTLNDAFTITEHDLLKSGTAQTANVEKAIHPSGIPSLDQLSNELLNKGTTTSLDQAKIYETTTAENEIIKTDATLKPTTEFVSKITKTDIVSSKRAGFLDFSARPIVGTEPAIVQKNDNPIDVPRNDISNTPVIGTSPRPLVTPKNSGMASQSQLAEDAINEELMKEEILSDNKDAQRQRQDSLVVKSKNIEPKVETTPTADTSVEDKLRVKPISPKPQGRYTISPNYKPLKKIEIQPPKSFLRNPDDNSWRNESLSSLGIVFKANNSSKPFTQVLKNKTETELNTTLGLNSKEDTLELRVRLEKIAEQRKSKKKKINQYGETVYTDYEESISAENLSTTTKPDESPIDFAPITAPQEVPDVGTNPPVNQLSTLFNFDLFKTEPEITTSKSKKVVVDYDAEEEEPDYTLANIDLKKFNIPVKKPEPPASIPPPPPPSYMFTTPPTTRTYTPERKPTIQYFPPREKQKVVVQDYDTDFQRKINAYTYTVPRNTQTVPTTVTAQSTYLFPKTKFEPSQRPNDIRQPEDLSKNIYLTHAVPLDHGEYLVPQDVSFNRGSYVIKHLRDFINDVVKADENPNFAVTEVPIQGVTSNQVIKENSVKPPSDYYDYEAQFKKDVLDRFVENFNQNSDRFKADFPILYNTTVVHNKLTDVGRQASSSAFMKRLYDDARAIQHAGRIPKRYDPNCDRTVELSPAYELHYYVPEEEEKEEFQPKAASIVPYAFRI